jgi:tRNA/tmRNA/rRNA uracil-C5-methylase (TrmA/RlmC/RlmD family)
MSTPFPPKDSDSYLNLKFQFPPKDSDTYLTGGFAFADLSEEMQQMLADFAIKDMAEAIQKFNQLIQLIHKTELDTSSKLQLQSLTLKIENWMHRQDDILDAIKNKINKVQSRQPGHTRVYVLGYDQALKDIAAIIREVEDA